MDGKCTQFVSHYSQLECTFFKRKAIFMLITQHALDRWRMHSGSKQTNEKCLAKIEMLVQRAKPIALKRKYVVFQLIAHNGNSAEYLKDAETNYIFVLVNGKLVTLYPHKSDQFVQA